MANELGGTKLKDEAKGLVKGRIKMYEDLGKPIKPATKPSIVEREVGNFGGGTIRKDGKRHKVLSNSPSR